MFEKFFCSKKRLAGYIKANKKLLSQNETLRHQLKELRMSYVKLYKKHRKFLDILTSEGTKRL